MQRRIRAGCRLWGWLLSAIALPAMAGSPAGFTRKLWQTQDGLPEQTVQAFAETPDGHLWIGTTGGLLRFDGAHFTLFDQENTPALAENSVFSLLASRDGSLWIGTEGGGLLRLLAGRLRAYGARDGLSDGFVRALYEDRGGTIWVGTDNGLMRLREGRLERVDGIEGRPAMAVHAIAGDHRGGLWAGGSRLVRIADGAAREYRLGGGGSQDRVKSILETRDHTVWVGTVSGLNRLRPGAQEFEPVAGIKGTVRVLRQTADGTLWVGMIGQGIRALRGSGLESIRAPDTLPSNTVLNLFEDGEGNIWIGTQAGLLRLTRTPVRIVPLPQAADSDFGTIYADRDGSLWVVSTGVFHLRGDVAEPYSFPGLPHLPVRNLFRDRRGDMWIGTDGEGVIRTGSKRLWMTTRDGLVNNFIRAMLESRDGSMWFATDEGVSRWTPRGFTNYLMRDGLSYFSTRVLLEDSRGDLWIGTDRGLNRLHGGSFVRDEATRQLAQEKVWAIHEDPDGGLWFGTRSDGLYRWRRGRMTHYTTAQGLATNSIYQIIEDARGGLWLSGPNGISLVRRSDLDAMAEEGAQHLSLTLYGIANEVETTEIYGGRQPSGCLDARGDVWFPSDRGPIHILRDPPRRPPPPAPLAVSEVELNGRMIAPGRPVVIGPGGGRLEIGYAPILLGSQDGVRFRYRLDGFDTGWTDAATHRTASYTNLPPGRYVFHVQAFEVSHPEAVSEASIGVVAEPRFYRTRWFLLFAVLGAAALVLAVYRLRLWRMKMRFEAVLEERNRVAREMHDTVIQGCASVSALLEAVASLGPAESRLTGELVEHARTQVRATIDEARQAVWNLRQGKPSEDSLAEAVEQMASRVSGESGIPVSFELTGRPFRLNQLATHELLMMAREAVYNAVQHAGPARIEICLRFERRDVTLEVRDDGAGFDPALIGVREGCHFGLMGMRERVQTVGGQFHLESARGRGTGVRIRIPRRVSAAENAMSGA